jgi:kumamolisin
MSDQITQGDSTKDHGLNANMAKLSNEWLDQGISDANAAPTSNIGKIAEVTGKGLLATPAGIGHALVDDAVHWQRTLGTVATSAAMGAVLKTVLPESGTAGKIAGAGIGLYFMAKAATPVVEAYADGLNAKTKADIDKAGDKVGDAVGGFGVNSVVAFGGYRLGAGFMGKALMTEPFDNFAAAKEKFWNPSSEATKPPLDVLEPTKSPGFASRVKIDGDRATLLNSDKAAPANAKVTGEVDPKAPMNVTLYAQTRGSDFQMSRDLARINSGMQAPLTDAQITAKYGANPESVTAIEKFAADNGLAITDRNLASGRIQLSGSTGQMMKAFDVKLQEYEHQSGVTFRGRTGTVSVSSDLAPHVKAVLGLDNRPAFKPNYVSGGLVKPPAAVVDNTAAVAGKVEPKAPTPSADGARALQVEEILKGYNADPKFDGKGMTTGFLSLGGTVDEGWQDVLTAKGIDPKTVEFRNTSTQEPTSDPGGANGENRLDFYMHKFGLPKATTVMVEAENNDTGMPTGIDRITFPKPGETQITHASVSWGQYEDGWTAQSRALMEDAGKRAALKGVTVTVASGDNGAGDGSPSRKQQVDIPAGLEHFTGAGGTRLVVDANGNWKSEVGWDGMGASGGGRSMFTPRPDFQKGLDLPANLNGSKFDGRAVPDIAANGDPRSGMITPGPQGDEAIGGTSLSAPTTAVQAAIISQATGKGTGYWNPEIYNMAKNNPGVFHDIVSGRNTDGGVKGYPATKGYDLETGNGSIDVGKYIEARGKMLNQSVLSKNLSMVPGFVNPRGDNPTPGVIPFAGATYNSDADKAVENPNK